MSQNLRSLDTSSSTSEQPIERLVKLVRVRSASGARFVEFDFAIDDPRLFVELILPREAFKQFCERNQVQMMSEEQASIVDGEFNKWRYGEETLMASNHDRTSC